MEQTEISETVKPMAGAWDNAQGYPIKIKFELDKPILVTFDANFTGPTEMPNADGNGVFYIFNVKDGNGDNASIATSAWTMINSLKSHAPLAGKSLIITKKNIKGKNFFYIERPGSYNAPKVEPSEVDTQEAGISEDRTM